MTQYIVKVSDYGGLVPGAKHFRGRVEGPYPQSCHGATHMGATKSGKRECDEGHVLADRVTWDVEAEWTEERHERHAAAHYEGDGPQQFLTKRDVLDRAIVQFLDGSSFPCEEVQAAAEGDELWYGWIARAGGQDDEHVDPEDGWGMMIARKNTG
jgi:hypothetical protein